MNNLHDVEYFDLIILGNQMVLHSWNIILVFFALLNLIKYVPAKQLTSMTVNLSGLIIVWYVKRLILKYFLSLHFDCEWSIDWLTSADIDP